MRLRALLALAAVAAAVGAAPAVADGNDGHNFTCIYYKWNAATSHWDRVVIASEQDYEWEPDNERPKYSTWDCKYCYIPTSIIKPPQDPNEVLAKVDAVAASAGRNVPDLATTGGVTLAGLTDATGLDSTGSQTTTGPILNPTPPTCPKVPPEASYLGYVLTSG